MKGKIIGKTSGSFSDKTTGEMVTYGRLYVITDFPRTPARGEISKGQMCAVVKCSFEDCEDLEIGDIVLMDVNKYGRAMSIDVLPPQKEK